MIRRWLILAALATVGAVLGISIVDWWHRQDWGWLGEWDECPDYVHPRWA